MMKRFKYLTLAALVAFAACDVPPPEVGQASMDYAAQDQVEVVTQTPHLQTSTGVFAAAHPIVDDETPIPKVADDAIRTTSDNTTSWTQQPIMHRTDPAHKTMLTPDDGRSMQLFPQQSDFNYISAPTITATMRRAHLGSGTARLYSSAATLTTTYNRANGPHTARHLLA